MGIILTVFSVIGTILLIVLAVILALILLVLFVPIRYHWKGRIEDPVPREEIDAAALKNELAGSAEITWLLGLVRARVAWPSQELLSLKILGLRFPLEKFLKRSAEETEEEEETEEKEGPEEKKSLRQKLEELPAVLEKNKKKADHWLGILEKPSTKAALKHVTERLFAALRHFVPKDWHLNGVLGLGDPAAGAGVLQACGLLYPVTDGRLRLDTDFMMYRFDIDTEGKGHVRLVHLAAAAVRIILNRNVRSLIGNLRRKKGAKHVAA